MIALRYWALFGCLTVGLCLGFSCWCVADDDDGEMEVEVSIEKVPAPVKKTILKQAGKNEINEIERITAKVFEAEWLVGEIEVEICVSAGGRVEKIEVEPANDEKDEEDEDDDDRGEGDEKKVKLNKVPKPVKKTIQRLAGGNKITEIEQVTRTVYEADWFVKGREVEIVVCSGGCLLEKGVEEPEDAEDDDDDD